MDQMHIQYFEENVEGRDFIIGDLHGCMDYLEALMSHVNFDKAKDRLFSVGDIIDRGPRCVDALNLIHEPWFHMVLGNHELMLSQCVLGSDPLTIHANRSLWQHNGGDWSEGIDPLWLRNKAELICVLPRIIVVGKDSPSRFHVWHAEFVHPDPNIVITNQYIDEEADLLLDDFVSRNNTRDEFILWGRSMIMYDAPARAKDPTRPIVQDCAPSYCGHTPVMNVVKYQSQIYIDTGAFINAVAARFNEARHQVSSLTMVCHTDQKIYQYKTFDNTINEIVIGEPYKLKRKAVPI